MILKILRLYKAHAVMIIDGICHDIICGRVIMIADKCAYMKKKECYGQSVPPHSFFYFYIAARRKSTVVRKVSMKCCRR